VVLMQICNFHSIFAFRQMLELQGHDVSACFSRFYTCVSFLNPSKPCVTICTTRVLPITRIYLFHMIITVNQLFPETTLTKGSLRFLCGTDWMMKCYKDELSLQRLRTFYINSPTLTYASNHYRPSHLHIFLNFLPWIKTPRGPENDTNVISLRF
jgi:hypothetical protein